jgi:recombination protein RecT
VATTTRARAAVAARQNGEDPNTAVAKANGDEQPKQTVAGFIRAMQPELARALPKGMDADRMARLVLTVVRQSEREWQKGNAKEHLGQCTPESFAGAILTAASLGLEPGVNGEAYLVPYKHEATLIIGYQGYAKLFYQHPLARNLDCQAIFEHDEFDYAYGTTPFLKHKPKLGERGKVIGYYAVATLSTGASAFVVLSPEQVKELRGGKVGPKGQIKDPERWMERKTALRQLAKMLPKSANMTAAIAVDEQSGRVLSVNRVADAITAGDAVPSLPSPIDADGVEDEQPPAGVDAETGEVTEAYPDLDEADRQAQAEYEAEQQRAAGGLFADGTNTEGE